MYEFGKAIFDSGMLMWYFWEIPIIDYEYKKLGNCKWFLKKLVIFENQAPEVKRKESDHLEWQFFTHWGSHPFENLMLAYRNFHVNSRVL